MANVEFKYAPMFQLGEDKTEYRLISKDGVSVSEFEGTPILKVSKEALELLTTQAFHDVNFMLRREHNEKVASIRVSCLSVRIPVLLSFTAKRVSRYGLVSKTKSLSQRVSITHTPQTTCAILRTLLWICITK